MKKPVSTGSPPGADNAQLPFNARLLPRVFTLPDKSGKMVSFNLLPAQREYYLRRTSRTIIHKARQLGMSYVIDADLLLDAILNDNRRAAIIAHEAESTRRLFARCRRLIKDWRLGHPPRLIDDSKSALSLENGSVIYVGTAGSKFFGRGDTLHRVHLSEFDYYEESERTLEAVLNAVPKEGVVEIESSARASGGALHQLLQASQEPGAVWSSLFFPWTIDAGYVAAWNATWDKTDEERQLQEHHHLSNEQLAWRRTKLNELRNDLNAFQREFPLTSEEAFQSGLGRGAFSADALRRYSRLGSPPFRRGDLTWSHGEPCFTIDQDGWLWLWQDPQKGHSYVVGADPGGGSEASDPSVAHVMDCSTGAIVAEVWGRIPPDRLAVILDSLGSWYHRAWVCPEANNHGTAVILALRDQRRYPRIQPRTVLTPRQDPPESGALGWLTTTASKPLLITQLDRALRDGALPYIPPRTLGELSSYQTTAFGYSAPSGLHDDCVMSLAITVDTFLRHRAPLVVGGRPLGDDTETRVSHPPASPNPSGY